MWLPIVGTIVKIVGKLLPDKPKAFVEELVTKAVTEDAEYKKFLLSWFSADRLPAWAIAVKNLWRPFLAVTYGLFTMVHFIVYQTMPDKYFMLLTLSITSIFGVSRGIEKIKKHIV